MVFYDTSSLLQLLDKAFAAPFAISIKTLEEIENIKTSERKSPEVKYKARHLARLIDSHYDMITIYPDVKPIYNYIESMRLPITPDNIIVATAAFNDCEIFYTDDICLKTIARGIFGLKVASAEQDESPLLPYKGYQQICLGEPEYFEFLSSLKENRFECLTNEYVILYDSTYSLRDVFRWNGTEYVSTQDRAMKSTYLGDKLKAKDEFQRAAIDSLRNNTITALTGQAGTGKSLLCLATAMSLVERGNQYNQIVIMANPIPLRGAKEVGYLPGTMNEKLLSGNLGNILNSKFGDRIMVEQLISSGKIRLLNMADCRGVEIADNQILYITEAQNTSIDLMKIILTRASSGAKIFVEGDYMSQVDDAHFANGMNGLRRLIDAFKGEELFGYVDLPNVHRSKLAELAATKL